MSAAPRLRNKWPAALDVTAPGACVWSSVGENLFYRSGRVYDCVRFFPLFLRARAPHDNDCGDSCTAHIIYGSFRFIYFLFFSHSKKTGLTRKLINEVFIGPYARLGWDDGGG